MKVLVIMVYPGASDCYKMLTDENTTLVTDATQLESLRFMQKIWWQVFPGIPFDEGKFRALKAINGLPDRP